MIRVEVQQRCPQFEVFSSTTTAQALQRAVKRCRAVARGALESFLRFGKAENALQSATARGRRRTAQGYARASTDVDRCCLLVSSLCCISCANLVLRGDMQCARPTCAQTVARHPPPVQPPIAFFPSQAQRLTARFAPVAPLPVPVALPNTDFETSAGNESDPARPAPQIEPRGTFSFSSRPPATVLPCFSRA